VVPARTIRASRKPQQGGALAAELCGLRLGAAISVRIGARILAADADCAHVAARFQARETGFHAHMIDNDGLLLATLLRLEGSCS
jgi:hypothetical protein